MNWNNKQVLVTGADGFIGSHLVEMLQAKGAKVKALSYYNSFNYWGWLEDVSCLNDISVVSGDVRDPFFCNEITKGIDVVFHLAALIAIPYSYVAPQNYIQTNVTGTLNMCQAALNNKCERIICTSTSEVYGTAQYVPIDEKHPLQAQSPYSASKIGADALSMSFYNAFNLPLTIARPFNTFGPRQSLRAVIPNIICQMLEGKKEIKLGDITPTRDFNFVKDTCNGIILLAESQNTLGKTVNIGSGTEISIKDLFFLLKDLIQSDANFVTEDLRKRPEKSEVFRLNCDNSLIKELTGFKPSYTLKSGLLEAIDWYKKKENLSKFKTHIYNV
ncbi:MAG: NAD-dependent 4,6-dehydratase LegB [Salinivirgaceae bacterium]|jgi:NAD dependent epimerase/dehydratase